MVKQRILQLVLIVTVLVWLFAPGQGPAYAQETTDTPTPTVTPTPRFEEDITLSSGNHAVIERRLTYGDIAIVGMLGVIAVILAIYFIIRVPRLWLR